ncbi:hypothetical protein ISS05_00160 [Candidatus Woesearchaeota archaeon]|nr:hypothetical protein [Candidatus Woesearchaeota archaeon]
MVDEKVDDIFKDFNFGDDENYSPDEMKKKAQREFDRQKFDEPEERSSRDEIKELKEQMSELREHIKFKGEMKERPPVKDFSKHINPEPRFNFNKPRGTPERPILIGLIIFLSIFIIVDLSFYEHISKSSEAKGEDELRGIVISELNESEENNTGEVKEEVAEKAIEEKNETVEKEEVNLSGKITLSIDKIYDEAIEGDNKGKISEIVFTIDNGKNYTLKPFVNVYIYDSESEDVYETRSRGDWTYSSGIESGTKKTGRISLTPQTYYDLDLERHIRIVLNDTNKGFITSLNKDITIS